MPLLGHYYNTEDCLLLDAISVSTLKASSRFGKAELLMEFANQPYALSSEIERKRRIEMMGLPHMRPLADYVLRLHEKYSEYSIPHFDPCDGGIEARVLFLLEAPGPKAVASGFVSRNNPDPTARNICELWAEANLARRDTLIWNIVPWYVGDGQRIRAVDASDLREALPHLKALLELLPYLKAICLVGKKAQNAKAFIRPISEAEIFETHHPSARVFNVWPHKRDEVKADLLRIDEAI